jgi:hypothetical protein
MAVYSEQHAGVCNRGRNRNRNHDRFGGSSAWKQHYVPFYQRDFEHRHRLMRDRIEEAVAYEQLSDALVNGDEVYRRRGNQSKQQDQRPRRQTAPVSTVVVIMHRRVDPDRRRFKAVISESGKIVAMAID